MNKNNVAQNFNDVESNKHMDHVQSMQIVQIMDSMINDMKSKITKLKTEKLSLPLLPQVDSRNDTLQSSIDLPSNKSSTEFEIINLLPNLENKNISLNTDCLVLPEIKHEKTSRDVNENMKQIVVEDKNKFLNSDSFILSELKQNSNVKQYLSIPSLSTILSIEPVTAENMLSYSKLNLEKQKSNANHNKIVVNKTGNGRVDNKFIKKSNVLCNKNKEERKSASSNREFSKNLKTCNITKLKPSSQTVYNSQRSANSNNRKQVFNQNKTSTQRKNNVTSSNITNNCTKNIKRISGNIVSKNIKKGDNQSLVIINDLKKKTISKSQIINKKLSTNKMVPQKPKSANSNKQLNKISSKQLNKTSSKQLNKTASKQLNNTLSKTSSKQLNKSHGKQLSRPTSASVRSINNHGFRMAAGHSDPFQDFVNIVNKAKLDRKIFTVVGNYFSIRRSLIERGWLEKVRLLVSDTKGEWKQFEHLPNNVLFEYMKDKVNGEKYRKALIYKLLCRHQVDFYWDYTTNPFTVNSDKIKRTMINRYPPGSNRIYGSKAGLCESLSESHWYCIDGLSHVRYPRTYNLASEFDLKPFIDDFHLTACTSLLKWIIKTADDPVLELLSSTGKIPIAVFNFAIIQCQNYLKIKQHKDIDEPLIVPKENDWEVFLDKYYKLIHSINHFKFTNKINKQQMVEQSRTILKKMEKYWPNILIDGYMNLWLLKPHNGSQGYGILVCRTLKYITDTIKNVKDRKYVIQKYIERPLLIYNTKFDIRQFFLLIHQPYLQLWMYKDCYLRFSSQNFSLSKLHESIHLTNNSVQCRYKNTQDRNAALPVHNMWHCDTFKRYLHDIGHPSTWNNIYKEMKEALVALIMCCQDKIIARINSFELCGVDFMLAEDFHPYLIEINTRPALYNSTPITARICPALLEDLVKVTVDYARNPKASTGKFELIYKENNVSRINYDKCSLLSINGVNYFRKYKHGMDITFTEKTKEELDNGLIKNVLKINPDQVKKDVKNTLEQILSIIHIEREKRLADQEMENTKSETFKTMLSEFVSIISTSEAGNLDPKNVKHIQ